MNVWINSLYSVKVTFSHYVCSYTWLFSQRLPIKKNNHKHFIKTKLPFMSKYINCSKHTLFQVTSFCSFLQHKSDTVIKLQVYVKRSPSIYVCTRRVKFTTSPVNKSALMDLYPQSNGIVHTTQDHFILPYVRSDGLLLNTKYSSQYEWDVPTYTGLY